MFKAPLVHLNSKYRVHALLFALCEDNTNGSFETKTLDI